MKLTLTSLKKSNEIHSLVDNEFFIHEGSSYQAAIPKLNSIASPNDHDAVLVWKPTDLINDTDLRNYVDHARCEHHMNQEQALAILTICKYKISASKSLMEKYTPENDEWTTEDKFLFEQAYQSYGKTFSRIRQMLPGKTIAELVKYYYSWKKVRIRESVMDQHVQQCQLLPDDEDSLSDDDDDDDDNEKTTITSISALAKDLGDQTKISIDQNSTEDQECCSCGVISESMHSTPTGTLCHECFLYWKKSGSIRTELYRTRRPMKKLKGPPKNMSLDLDNSNLSDPIEKLEDDIRNELSKIQSLNQSIESLTIQSRADLERMRIPFLININQLNQIKTSTWSTEEILLTIQALAKYGKDFKTISLIIGPTKTAQDIEKFFREYRDRYQLDTVIDLNIHPIKQSQKKPS